MQVHTAMVDFKYKRQRRFHAINIGNMTKRTGEPQFVACTPRAVIELLKSSVKDIAGKRAVVIGRSDIVVSL